MPSPHPSTHRPQHGFVLLLVLVFIVVIGLIAALVAEASSRVLAEAERDQQALADEVERTDTLQRLLFLLGTQRHTAAGLTVDEQVVTRYGNAEWITDDTDGFNLPPPFPVGNEIALDGRAYAASARTRFALQDAAGLVSINWASPAMRALALQRLGSRPEEISALEAKRLDFQDSDDEYRIGGAEARQYRSSGIPPPTNRTLLSPLQLRSVLGWHELLTDISDWRLLSLFSTHRTVGLNVNTATVESLHALPGLDGQAIDRILAVRNAQPFLFDWEFRRAFPVSLGEEEPLLFLSSGAGLVWIWSDTEAPMELVQWTLTPVDKAGRPWRIDYRIRVPREKSLVEKTARPVTAALFSTPGQAGN